MCEHYIRTLVLQAPSVMHESLLAAEDSRHVDIGGVGAQSLVPHGAAKSSAVCFFVRWSHDLSPHRRLGVVAN